MKKIVVLWLITVLSLCSCETGREQSNSDGFLNYSDSSAEEVIEQSIISWNDMSNHVDNENENIGKFGGEYTFDYHYAQTPESFFYIKKSANGNGDGIVRFSKNDFADNALIASKEAFGVAVVDQFYAEIVGLTSKWLYVAVANTSGTKDVYGLSHDGNTKEKLLENVKSVYFHHGNGILYFTQNDKDGIGGLYSLDLITDATTEVDTGECTVNGLYWCQLKGEKIGFINYPNNIIIDAEGKIDVMQTIPPEERADKCLGRDESLKAKVEGFVNNGRELISYAECGDYIYYIDIDADGKTTTLNRIDVNGTYKTVLKENTEIIELYSYEGVLYGDVTYGDVAYLVKVSDTGEITRTEAVTGVGQWGYIRIEDGLLIRTYEVAPTCPSLVYVYNPLTNQAITNQTK